MHETSYKYQDMQDSDNFYARAYCTCGWEGYWRDTLWSYRGIQRAANRHERWARFLERFKKA